MSEPPGPAEPAARHTRHAHDDLLSGFDEPGRRQAELRGYFASTLGASLFAWDITFTLGAYHTVFYARLMQLLVVSTVLLLGALVLRREVQVLPWMVGLQALPLTWLVWRLLAPIAGTDTVYHIVDFTLIGLILVTLPLTLWVIARLLAPDYFALSTRRLRLSAVVIVGVIALTGLLVGWFNYRFITCADFVVAGDFTPQNCRQLPPPPSQVPPPSPAPS